MAERRNSESNLKKMLPFLTMTGLVGAGFLGSLFVIDPKIVRDRLRAEYRSTWENLQRNSNELDDVLLAIENLPTGSEPHIAEWINAAMEGKRRAIYKGRVKPHHVMCDVLEGALAIAGRPRRR